MLVYAVKSFSSKCFVKMAAEADPKSDFPEKLFLKTVIKSENYAI